MRLLLPILTMSLLAGCTVQVQPPSVKSNSVDVPPRIVQVQPVRDDAAVKAVVEAVQADREVLLEAIRTIRSAPAGSTEPAGDVAQPRVTAPTVDDAIYMYSASWCGPCQQCKNDVAAANRAGANVNLKVVDVPSMTMQEQQRLRIYGRNLPVFSWQRADGTWTQHDGYPGLGQLLDLKDGRQLRSDAGAVQYDNTVQYTLPTMRYAMMPRMYSGSAQLLYTREWRGHSRWPGDLRAHMAADHGVDASGMDDVSAVTMHDSLPENQRMSGADRRRLNKYGHL